MTDLFKVLFGFGVFLALCAIGEIIAEYAPWIIWILIPVVVYVVFIATFGNYLRKEDEE